MLRFVVAAAVIAVIAALLTRNPRARRAIWALLVLVAAYGVLKATGVIEAIAPDRNGVF
jgi:hypothetical protein